MAQALAHILAHGKRFGNRWYRRTKPIALSGAARHLACWGLPGMGKSSFIFFQILQNITAHSPFILFDTHSDLFLQVLAALIAQGWNPEDVIIVDPPHQQFGCPGINVFDTEPGQTGYEVIDELLGAFKQIWWDSWGARMEDILRNTFLALQEAGLTLAEAERFLTDTPFRSALVQTLAHDEVKHYWLGHFAALKESEQRFFVEAPRNKLSAFLGSPYIKPLFAQTASTLRFAELMNQGKCILVNLSRNHLKEARGLLGALILAKLSLAILSRESIAREDRLPVDVFCDEAHEYFVRDCLNIATGSRKFGVSYRIFSQGPSQYRDDDADILFSTIGTQVVFNVDRKSAERLAKELFSPSGRHIKHDVERDFWGPKAGHPVYWSVQEELEHYITELTTQRVGECYIRMKGLDQDPRPYIATIPEVAFPQRDLAQEEAFRQASAAAYYTPLEKIEDERRQRLARWVTPSLPKIKNRS